MDSMETEHSSLMFEKTNGNEMKEEKSIENFQKIIYELFEKNGVMNDLRAYLRKHVIDVLKSASFGDITSQQKHFTQRLELPMQAINILIAEYLLRFEFSYSLSVFISEIPLGSMVFDFARALRQGAAEPVPSQLHFKEDDVFSILNYLGVKLDSDRVCNVIDMYRKEENASLLICILKSMAMYRADVPSAEHDLSSLESVHSNSSAGTVSEKPRRNPSFNKRCRHYSACRSCRSTLLRVREKYRNKKKSFVKNLASKESVNEKTLLESASTMDATYFDELFEQLKSVFEAEVEMMRAEEQQRMKRSLASHALKLTRQRQEMEEAFKAREEQLEQSVKQKKQFLWGLARSLRAQHEQLERAARAVRRRQQGLGSKEDTLRIQSLEAEQELKRRGEDIREQISSELLTLESHLEDMKKEKDSLQRERSELEQLKMQRSNSTTKVQYFDETQDLRASHESLRSELLLLKKFIEMSHISPRATTEASTMTDPERVSRLNTELLNNEQRRPREEPSLRHLLVNDLKKQKIVNFSIADGEEMGSEHRDSSSAEGAESRTVLRLREENERLREFSRMQQGQIVQLARAAGALRAEAERREFDTAPRDTGTNSAGRGSVRWHVGAGEQLALFAGCAPPPRPPRTPADRVPFIPEARTHADTRRQLISQWRALRRAAHRPQRPPPAHAHAHTPRAHTQDTSGPSASPPVQDGEGSPLSATPEAIMLAPTTLGKCESGGARSCSATAAGKSREKSPKTMLLEAKEKLRTQSTPKYLELCSSRDKSPSSVLREAKLRLRKLEIEAEAVEQSYRHFRQRQNAMRPQHQPEDALVTKDTTHDIDAKSTKSKEKFERKMTPESADCLGGEIGGIGGAAGSGGLSRRLTQRVVHTTRTAPIPRAFSPASDNSDKYDNYLDTPLNQFRTYYHPELTKNPKAQERNNSPVRNVNDVEATTTAEAKDKSHDEPNLQEQKEALIKEKKSKEVELEILKNNINKMYNINGDNAILPLLEERKDADLDAIAAKESTDLNPNMLLVEVEPGKQISAFNAVESDPTNVVVMVENNLQLAALLPADSENDVEKTQEVSGNMTILISPKRSSDHSKDHSGASRRSVSPEQAARLTRNDVFEAIFHADPTTTDSSHDIHPDSSKENAGSNDSNSQVNSVLDNYPDDFSGDVDNYNVLSDNLSPVSLAKSPADDIFWDE